MSTIFVDPYRFGVPFSNDFSNSIGGTDEFVNFGDHTEFDVTTDFTFMSWVKLSAFGTPTYASVFGKWNSSAASQAYIFAIHSSGRLVLFTNSGSALLVFSDVGAAISLNTWFHISVSHSGGVASFFIDGVAGGTPAIPACKASNENLNLGRYPLPDYYLTGLMAQPAIFKGVALDVTEILEAKNLLMGDMRTHSQSAFLTFAANFPGGQSDFSTWNDYVSGNGGTMTNQENTDINVDVPV